MPASCCAGIKGCVALTGMCCVTQVRNKDRLGELQALGANEVIDVTTEDVIARVKAITGAVS